MNDDGGIIEPGELPRRMMALLALTPRAASVASEADRLARSLGAELLFLHVGEGTAENREALSSRLREVGMGDRTIVFRTGRVHRTICHAAKELSVDLLVLGALEREGAIGYYVGSVARRVARRAHCSVLLLTEPRVEARAMRRWVVGVDYTPESQSMLRSVVEWARREKPESIHLVHEYVLPGIGLGVDSELDARGAERVRQKMQEQEQSRLVEFLGAFGCADVAMRPVCLRGREGWELNEYAKRKGADLLIAAAPRRLTFWDKFFQHGVEFSLESLPCALLLHRDVGRARER